jgi:spermidine/putrescine transport system substrate-binding protein
MNRLLALTLVLAGCGPAEPELKLLTWPDYFAESTIPAFEKEFRCKVRIDYLDNSETLRTKLEGGASGYDVVMPSDEVVPALASRGLLEKLDPAKLPNLKNLAARWRGLPYDPKGELSVPYAFGSTGLAYRKDLLPAAPDSWAALWDPKLAGAVSMLDDGREAVWASMRLDGAPAPTADAIAKAAKRFEGWKPRAWNSGPKELLVNGDVKLAQAYSGDALQAAADSDGKVAFVIPKEGGTLWFDNLCIAKGAAQRELAHAFIDYLLRPEVSAALTNERRFGNPNEAARAKIAKELQENRLVFPADDDLKRLAPLPPLGPDVKKALDAAWAGIREK